MNENIERLLEMGIGMLLGIIAISLMFIYQDLVDSGYKLLLSWNGG